MKETRKVSLKTLFGHVCAKWRIILLAAVLGGVVLGGYRVAKLWPETKVSGDTQQNSGESGGKTSAGSKTAAGGSSDSYYDEIIARIDKQILSRERYLTESLYMNLDFSNLGIANAELYIVLDADQEASQQAEEDAAEAAADAAEASADAAGAEEAGGEAAGAEEAGAEEAGAEEAGVEAAGAETGGEGVQGEGAGDEVAQLSYNSWRRALILSTYKRFVQKGLDWTEKAEELNTETQYIQELIKLDNYNASVGSFTIIIRAETPELANEILDEALDQIRSFPHDEIPEAGNYTLRFTKGRRSNGLDNSGLSAVKDRVSELNSLMQAKDSFKTNVSKKRDASTSSAPKQKKARSRKDVLKSGVKYFAAGAFAGAVGAAVLYAIWLLLRGVMLSGKEFNDTCGFLKIAAVPRRDYSKLRGLDRLAASIDGAYLSSQDAEAALRVAETNILNLAGKGESIAVIPLSCPERAEELAKKLSCPDNEFHVIGSVGGDASALNTLRDCGSVLVVSEVLKTDYRDTDDLLRILSAYDKQVLGSIAYC